jgi:hypothetical protein
MRYTQGYILHNICIGELLNSKGTAWFVYWRNMSGRYTLV